jgi:predicted solute-binding protein
MVHKDIDAKDLALFVDTLYVGLDEGVDALSDLAHLREDLRVLPREITTYLHDFRYDLGRSEQQAIDQFRHALNQLDR